MSQSLCLPNDCEMICEMIFISRFCTFKVSAEEKSAPIQQSVYSDLGVLIVLLVFVPQQEEEKKNPI